MTYPCPCCGFLVLAGPLGSYEICRICGWEDDEVQQRWPGYRGGANVESLCEAQTSFVRRIGAEIQLSQGARRHLGWRPLRMGECIGAESDPDREPHVYYWDRDQAV